MIYDDPSEADAVQMQLSSAYATALAMGHSDLDTSIVKVEPSHVLEHVKTIICCKFLVMCINVHNLYVIFICYIFRDRRSNAMYIHINFQIEIY